MSQGLSQGLSHRLFEILSVKVQHALWKRRVLMNHGK